MKQVSFRVSGLAGTLGTTIVPVSDILEGPYVVAIDGAVISTFETMEEPASGKTSLKLVYSHSEHDVTITGTSVVPEFPPYLIGLAVAIMIGTVIAVGRFKKSSL